MKIVGLIVEYNPLHTGHVYHFEEAKRQSKADVLITISSGSLAMRGEVCVFDKFTKAKQALALGTDIVIELPSLLSLNNADLFAKYCIMFLNNLKVNEIWIGSEFNKETIYEQYYNTMYSKEYDHAISKFLKEGNSFKKSSILAFESLNLFELKSNDILGLAYYKAIKDLKYDIKLKTIQRLGADDNDNNLSVNYSSAKSIRSQQNNFIDFLASHVKEDYRNLGFIDNNSNELLLALKVCILRLKESNLKEYAFVTDGIENKLKEIKDFDDLNSFVIHLSNKRFTSSKIRRMLLSILLDCKKDKKESIKEINFVRILGFNSKGQEYLSKIKKETTLYTSIKEGINEILDFEIITSRILDSIFKLNLSKNELLPPAILK